MVAKTFRVLEFKRLSKNSLIGFAKIEAPSGLIFNNVAAHHRNGSFWASPPSRPMLDRDGCHMKDANGKGRWVPLIEFADKPTQDRWSKGVIDALRISHPQVFDAAGGAT